MNNVDYDKKKYITDSYGNLYKRKPRNAIQNTHRKQK